MSRRPIVRAILALPMTSLLLLFSVGCHTVHPSYPSTWPKVTEVRDIENLLVGSYSCSGEIITTDTGLWTKTSITGFLIGGKNPPFCEHIEILRPEPSTLVIRFLNSDTEITKKTYQKDSSYHIRQGWVELSGYGEWVGEMGVAHESQTPLLSQDSEKNLIIKQKISMAGLLIIVPVGTSGTEWGKFERLN